MQIKSIKKWAWVHKWSSLVCTAFMLLLCLTGLPLIFSHEIDHLLGNEIEAPANQINNSPAILDRVIQNANEIYPNRLVKFVSRGLDDDSIWTVSLFKPGPSNDDFKFILVDAKSAKVLGESKSDEGFMHVMFRLHVDLFAGLPGMLFLGFMGLLLVIATISGVVLYSPFMRRLAFGDIRKEQSPKIKQLDTHNFLGIVTLVWVLVVGFTGVINTWTDLIIKYWQNDQVAEMTAPYRGLAPVKNPVSLQAAVDSAQAHEPEMRLSFLAFPETLFSTPHHFTMYMRGNSPVSERMFKPVLVDAKTAEVTDSREVPWYVAALLISQPLHFGDYGGMVLKIIWLIFDLIAIVILWTGLVLWWKKRNKYNQNNFSRTF